MPTYQMFLFPTRQMFIYVLIDVDARLEKRRQYLAKVEASPAFYGKTPVDIQVIKDTIEALEKIQALLLTMKEDALVTEELSEYLIPPTP